MATLNGKLVMFGGFNLSGNYYLGDTWVWDGAAWTEINTAAPSARTSASVATFAGNVVLFGGQGPGTINYADTWQWNGSTWTQLAASGPEARHGASMSGP
jgi:Galactose oxidase, central domain